MICIDIDFLKYGYVTMLFLWACCFVVLFAGIIKDECFPRHDGVEQFDEILETVCPNKFVALDIAMLERDIGCAPFDKKVIDGTQRLLPE